MYKGKRPENMCAPDSRFNVAINPKYGKKEEHCPMFGSSTNRWAKTSWAQSPKQ